MSKEDHSASNQGKKSTEPQVWIALIGAFTTIIVALLGFPPLIEYLTPDPTPTVVVPTIPALTETSTSIVNLFPSTETAEPTLTLISTQSEVSLPIFTETPSGSFGMQIRVYADRTTGKAPLTVKFDARDSFLRETGGQVYRCQGTCYYTWNVYSGGSKIGRTVENSTGTFSYRFGQQGTYMVTVWICRGQDQVDCGGNGVQIIVTK